MKRELWIRCAGPCLCAALLGCAPLEERGERSLEHDERMAWWREARFGMFIHWGLYAIPAGAWEGATHHAEWIRSTARIPLERYERFQSEFDPVRFDADLWASAARDAGMKYLVITSKHHDGFCLFDSAHTSWDVMETPFGRDVLRELSEACARTGVRFAVYHSIMDWHHPDYLPRRDWDRPSTGADFERYVRYLHDQVTELVSGYRPAVLWFDGEWENSWTHERGVALFELCRALDPALIVNNRVDVHRGGMGGLSQSAGAVGDFGTPEQEIPPTALEGVDWETCMTMNDHWGYNARDANWKSARELVRNLIDVASKGGNYLLNVGPKADGTFPDEALERLAEIGAWMRVHGEAIHGTRASPLDPLPFGRCTLARRGDDSILYIFVFEAPASGELVVPGLANEPVSARYLARPGEELPARRSGSDLVIELGGGEPDSIASVVALAFEGAPIVYRAPELKAAGDYFHRPLEVALTTRGAELEIRYTLDGTDPTERSPRYRRPIELTTSTTVSARSFHGGRAVSPVTRRRFTRLVPRHVCPPSGAPFIRCERFEGDWDLLPDFEALEPVASENASAIALGPDRRSEQLALRFTGSFDVPRDDVYVFRLRSDDGSDLWIDDVRVVDNDGLHGSLEKQGQAALAAGRHAFRLHWFNKTGGADLELLCAPLGGTPVPLGELR